MEFNKIYEIAMTVLRQLLTAGGTFLASKGLIGTESVETGVGALLVLIGIVWSVFTKNKDVNIKKDLASQVEVSKG